MQIDLRLPNLMEVIFTQRYNQMINLAPQPQLTTIDKENLMRKNNSEMG